MKPVFTPSGHVSPDTICAGDQFFAMGGRRCGSLSGTVRKKNRVTVDVDTLYMGKPMFLPKVPLSHLDGELRVKRGEIFLSSAFKSP